MTPEAGTVDLKPGSRWRSAVCQDRPSLDRGGAQPDAALAGGTLLGKRYTDEATGLQVLCVKPGEGTITVDGRPAAVVAPRQLPASD